MSKILHSGKGPKHYKEFNNQEVIESMEEVGFNVAQSLINENIKGDSEPIPLSTIMKKALNASYAQKHIKRAGTKDIAPVDSELEKAENYLHRARTGEWILND